MGDEGFDGEGALPGRGRCVGRYVLLRRLGAGGMGVVWAAWDPELDREVAIKLLRPRMTGEKARARLLREAQAMARVTHPNIIAVHDVGLVEGRVFVAMESIRGETLRAWLDAEPRPWKAIVAAYRQAALGLAAAHEAGLLHRDFKPENAMIDGSGRVRVMDFGLATAHEGREDEQVHDLGPRELRQLATDHSASGGLLATPLTEVGRVVGTPAFMAPEQLAGKRGGPASDQFSLCVALWQSLYGERPYAGDDLEALMSSFRDGRLRSPPARSKVPAKIRRVVERGLAYDPRHRWPDMAALAEALGAAEARRVWPWVLGLGALLVAVSAGPLWLDQRQVERCAERGGFARDWDAAAQAEVAAALREAGPHGEPVWTRIQPQLDAWVAGWSAVSGEACRERDGLPGALRVAQALCLERERDAFAATSGLLREADAEVAARAVDMVEALPAPERCADAEVLARLDGRAPPRDEAAAEHVRLALAQAEALLLAGRYAEAQVTLEAQRERAAGLGAPALYGELLAALGRVDERLGELERAAQRSGAAYVELLGAGEDLGAAEVATTLLVVYGKLAKFELARTWELQARALLERSEAGPEPRAALVLALAGLAGTEGEYREALALYEQAATLLEDELGEDSLALARMLGEMSSIQRSLGQLGEAEATGARGLELLAERLGPEHPELGGVHLERGNTSYRQGDVEGARRHFERAVEIVEPAMGSQHATVTAARTGLGAVALSEGEDEVAAALFRQALAGVEARLGDHHPDLVPPLVNLGVAQKRAGELESAEASQLRAAELMAAQHGPDHPNLQAIFDNLGELRMLRGDHEGAREAYARSLKIGETALGEDHPELDYALVGLGEAALAEGEAALAEGYFERVLASPEAEGKNQTQVALARFGLARALAARGEFSRARAEAERARTMMRAGEAGDPQALARVEAWLEESESADRGQEAPR
nr:tetratricopeptide repeat protein [Pseudenhygromyxa sp. WMMC2535]